jgi:TM2 domain-containing membrane protein YozV
MVCRLPFFVKERFASSRVGETPFLAGARMYEYILMQNMNDQQRMMFMAQMSQVRKDPIVGVLLAFFLGCFGAHRFYMGEIGMGVLYIVFCWTFIPGIVAFIECFLMPDRVRRYNEQEAYKIATYLGTTGSAPAPNSWMPVRR